jgi:hypothetical protein
MVEEFGEKCDFEVEDAIQKMKRLGLVTRVIHSSFLRAVKKMWILICPFVSIWSKWVLNLAKPISSYYESTLKFFTLMSFVLI